MTTRSIPGPVVILEARQRLRSPVNGRGHENSVSRVVKELFPDIQAQRVLGKSYKQISEDIYENADFAPAIRAAYKRIAHGLIAEPIMSPKEMPPESKNKSKSKKPLIQDDDVRRSMSLPGMFSPPPFESGENETPDTIAEQEAE